MITPTRDDCIWVAGFFDGEGGITLLTTGSNLAVGIGQRDEPLIRHIHTLFGGHFQEDTTPEGRPMWHVRWAVDTGARQFLAGILPFVRLKAAEVKFAIEWIDTDQKFVRLNAKGEKAGIHRRWRKEMADRLETYHSDRTQPLVCSQPGEGLRTPLL